MPLPSNPRPLRGAQAIRAERAGEFSLPPVAGEVRTVPESFRVLLPFRVSLSGLGPVMVRCAGCKGDRIDLQSQCKTSVAKR